MKPIILPASVEHSPKLAFYEIILKHDNSFPCAYIIVKSDFLLNGHFARDVCLNRILKNELSGIRFDFVNFICIVKRTHESQRYFSINYKIFVDWDDLEKKRPDLVKKEGFFNKEKSISYTSNDLFCGDVLVKTEKDYLSKDSVPISDDELKNIVSGTYLEKELFEDE